MMIVEFVTKVLQKSKMILFGHSFGSSCISIITHFHPELVMGLALVGTNAMSPTPGMRMYTAFGYGILAREMPDSEVMKRCKDPDFQKEYQLKVIEQSKELYATEITTKSGKKKRLYYDVPEDP